MLTCVFLVSQQGCYTAAIHYLRQIQVPVIIGLTAGMAILMVSHLLT